LIEQFQVRESGSQYKPCFDKIVVLLFCVLSGLHRVVLRPTFYYKKKTWHILDDWIFVQAFSRETFDPAPDKPCRFSAGEAYHLR